MTNPKLTEPPLPGERSLADAIARWSYAPLRSLGCLALALMLTVAVYWCKPPRFEARSDIVVVAIPSFSGQSRIVDISIDSAVQLLTSDQVLGTTARALNYSGGPDGLVDDLIISPVVNSRILRLYVRNEDPDLALHAVEMLSEELLLARSTRLERSSQVRLAEINARLQAIGSELDSIDSGTALSSLDASALLVDERTALEGEKVSIELLPTEAGFVARAAEVSDSPKRPYAPIYAASGLALGLCLAWLVAPTTPKRSTFNHLGRPSP